MALIFALSPGPRLPAAEAIVNDAPATAPRAPAPPHAFRHIYHMIQLPWVQNVLPFITSLTVHAAIVVLLIVFAKIVIRTFVPPPAERVQTTVATMDALTDGPPGGIPNVGLSNEPWEKVIQTHLLDNARADGVSSMPGPTLEMLSSGTSGDVHAANSIVEGPDALLLPGIGKIGSGHGLGTGPLAPIGLNDAGGAMGPRGPVFGQCGNAHKIIFVCDATGTMLNKMPTLKQQLENAIRDLKPVHSFNIVFFFDGAKLLAFNSSGMVMATPDNKKKAGDFLEGVTPTGQTDPFPALEMAFRQNPQLIYLLSDGGLDDNLRTNPEVLAKIDELEAQHHNSVKINTIMFDEDSVSGRAVLTKIAADHGGHFLFVTEAELNR